MSNQQKLYIIHVQKYDSGRQYIKHFHHISTRNDMRKWFNNEMLIHRVDEEDFIIPDGLSHLPKSCSFYIPMSHIIKSNPQLTHKEIEIRLHQIISPLLKFKMFPQSYRVKIHVKSSTNLFAFIELHNPNNIDEIVFIYTWLCLQRWRLPNVESLILPRYICNDPTTLKRKRDSFGIPETRSSPPERHSQERSPSPERRSQERSLSRSPSPGRYSQERSPSPGRYSQERSPSPERRSQERSPSPERYSQEMSPSRNLYRSPSPLETVTRKKSV